MPELPVRRSVYPSCLVVTSAVLALFLGGSLEPAALAQTTPLWEHQASDSIAFFRVTPLGSVLVATSTSLTSLDGTTGAPMWVRADKDLDDSNVIPLPATPFALVTWRTGFRGNADVRNGESDSFTTIRSEQEGARPLLRADCLQGAGRADGSGLVKLNVVTGKEESRLWLGDRTPEYEVDAIDSIVFFKQGKRQIVAFRM